MPEMDKAGLLPTFGHYGRQEPQWWPAKNAISYLESILQLS
jgi:hypothetical protein